MKVYPINPVHPVKTPWPTVRLGEVLTHYTKYIEVPEPREYLKLSVKLYGKGVVLDAPVNGTMLKMKRHQLAKAGQVILSEIWGKKGAIGFVPPEGEGALCTSHFFLFDVREDKLDRRWLKAIFDANYLQEQLDAEAKGTTGYAAVRPKMLLACEIPLPPLAEQGRVVARIEELAAQIHEARTLRHQAAEEAEALVHANRNRSFQELSAHRTRARLDTVASCRLGKMLDPRFKTGVGSTPYLRNANVQWDRLDLSEVYQMDFRDEERAEFALESGDIFVCEGGDIGKAAIWNNEIPGCCYQKALHRVRCDRERTLPRFVLHHLFWAANEGHWLELKTQTTIPHLTGVKLKAYAVFVPPLPKQRWIVSELDALQAEVDALKRLQAETAQELDALLPSILDRAFKGEL
jgi:type I restriction enzyme S subunit